MPLDRVNTARFHSDKEQSKNSALEQIKFIIANKKHLLKVRGGQKLLSKIRSFMDEPELTPNQKSEVDRIAELVWKGYDLNKSEDEQLGSFQTTYKPNKRTLIRYGNANQR
jgi:uncharacterized protein (DUF2384 family)